jgi:hypothetical protein
MSRQDVLDFQAYLADKYSLPDGVPPSIHQEVFGFVDNYVGAIRPTESDKWTQETIYADLVKMIWRVVTAVQTHGNALYPQDDEIPTVEQIEEEYQESIQGDVAILIEFVKKHMVACVKNAGGISLNTAIPQIGDWDAPRLRSAIQGANKRLNEKGWFVTLLDHKITILTKKAKEDRDAINWQNAL